MSESDFAERLPVFVYGTLLPGESNARVIDEGAVLRRERASTAGLTLYGRTGPYPFAYPRPDSLVVGELVWLADTTTGDRVRCAIDELEGFSPGVPATFYRRVEWEATDAAGGLVRCWTYLAAENVAADFEEGERIVHGDWRNR